MKRNVAIVSLLAVTAVLAGCSSPSPASDDAEPSAAAASAVSVEGMYKIENSADYTWVRMLNGQYGLWSAGDTCNADYTKAPATCLQTGTYTFNEDHSEATFVDDATGIATTTPFQVTSVGLDGSATTQNTGSSGGSKSGSQKPVATAFNLKKCLQQLALACNLLNSDPSGTGPEPLPEPTITLPYENPKKKVLQG